MLVRPDVVHEGCAWRCGSSLDDVDRWPSAGVPKQWGETDWRPVLQPLGAELELQPLEAELQHYLVLQTAEVDVETPEA